MQTKPYTAKAIEGRILHIDGLCIVIDKPGGVAVHGEPGVTTGRNLGEWLPHLRAGRSALPQIAHRLDRDTTGCLVLGRHPKALRKLGELFSGNRVEKVYWAVLEGALSQEEGTVELALGEKDATGRVAVDPAGKEAFTTYRVLGQAEGQTWVELRPRTGRTHQLRVHMAALGCPIRGDERYGAAPAGQLYLHARSLCMPLYPSRDPLYVEAPVPAAWITPFKM